MDASIWNKHLSPVILLDAGSILNHNIAHQPGAYILGANRKRRYVGRSDDDINRRLHEWISHGYDSFEFFYCKSPHEAYYWECQFYHDIGPINLDNKNHPDRPAGVLTACHVCGV